MDNLRCERGVNVGVVWLAEMLEMKVTHLSPCVFGVPIGADVMTFWFPLAKTEMERVTEAMGAMTAAVPQPNISSSLPCSAAAPSSASGTRR